MKESIEQHRINVESIQKAIDYDKQWYQEKIDKRLRELEFYRFQLTAAEKKKLTEFDRNKFLVRS